MTMTLTKSRFPRCAFPCWHKARCKHEGQRPYLGLRPGQSSESRISLNDSHDVGALLVSEDPYDYDSDEIPLPPLRVSMLAYGSLQTRRPTPLFRSCNSPKRRSHSTLDSSSNLYEHVVVPNGPKTMATQLLS